MLEFSLVVIPFVATLIACLQTSLVYFAQQNLETAAEKAGRQILTGSAQKSGTTQAQFKAYACAKLPSFMDCSKLMVDVRTATSFSTASTASPTITMDASGNPNNAWSYSPGNPGDIVIMRLMYLWPVQPGPLGFDISNSSQNRRLLVATAVFKSEPYS